MAHNISDSQLVVATLKNKNEFALLIDRYEAKFSRYIYRLTGLDPQTIEDILQEVFIKIYKNLNNFDQELKFSSWAYRIAHNETINYIRKYKNKQTISLESDDPDTANLINILEGNTDVAKEAATNELSATVRKALYKLPSKYKEVLVLYYLEEKDYAEIGDILKKPGGTIATLISRAKKKLKSSINHLKI